MNTYFRIASAIIIAAALAAAAWRWNRPESSAPEQATDDAYVQADFTMIVPQIAGVITEVAVSDHQHVNAGDLLLAIDDRHLRIAAQTAQTAIDSLHARLAQQHSVIAQARAAVASARAALALAASNRERFTNLARSGAGTLQAQQQAETEWETRQAALEREQAGLQAAERQMPVLRADLGRAMAAKAQTELDLSYTRVSAPVSGTVDQRRARVGGYARIGEPLLTLVPLDAVYIEANFRETQLARVRTGQPVRITVDALPGVTLAGRVASLAPASGVSHSTVPPRNATGNFTKITQRLPLRIQLEPGQEDTGRLRVGMSVQPRIQIGD